MRTSPVSLSAQAPDEGPRNKMSKGAATTMGLGSGVFPRFPAAGMGNCEQGAEQENDRPDAWFPLSRLNFQYENVRRPCENADSSHDRQRRTIPEIAVSFQGTSHAGYDALSGASSAVKPCLSM